MSSTAAEVPKPMLRSERKRIFRLENSATGPMLKVNCSDFRVISSKIVRVTKKAVKRLEMMPMHRGQGKAADRPGAELIEHNAD